MASRRPQTAQIEPVNPAPGLLTTLPIGLPATPGKESVFCLVRTRSGRSAATKDMTGRSSS